MAHKAVVIASLGLFVAAQGMAQSRSPMEALEIGAVGGLNSFTLAGSADSGVSSRTTFYAGVALAVPLGPHTFIEPELVYAGKGANYKTSDMFGAINVALRLSYLEAPVLLGLKFGGPVQPRLYAGPDIEVNINCEITAVYVGQPFVPNTVTCADAGLVMKKIDFGVTGGGGLTFAYGRGTISLEARYTLGLTTISTIRTITNRGYSLGVGYTMPLKNF